MAFVSSTSLAVLVIAVLTFVVYAKTQANNAKHKLPPGPKGLPLVGNMFQMPRARMHLQFLKWAGQYGEIFHVSIGSHHMVVLNSAEAANELLATRSKIYSGRREVHVAGDILSEGQRMVIMQYCDEWKVSRKAAQTAIGSSATKQLKDLQDLESVVLLKDLLDHGDKSARETYHNAHETEVPESHWFYLVRRFTTSVVLNIMYGQRIYKLHDNGHLQRIYDAMDNFTEMGKPGKFLADTVPFLRLLPDCLASWRVQAKKLHLWEMETWGGLLGENKRLMKAGTPKNCFVSSYLSTRAENGHEDAPGRGLTEDGQWMRDKLVAYVGATVLEAGSDTTAGTMQAFVLFMISHPYALRRAREEIDRVVGSERMPSFGDEEDLPYLVACIKETLRLRPSAPMGVPHRADQDDVYKGYFIPKGTTVFGNIWAIHMDPTRYANPTAFDPERFYRPGQPFSWASGPDSKDRDHYTFGWGRRFCIGSHFAEAMLFIACARIVWGLHLEPPKDERTGQPRVPDIRNEEATWTSGTLSAPKIFPVIWKARDMKRAQLIEQAFQQAQGEWAARHLETDKR